MHTRVQKWGNSLGLRIPRAFAAQAGVEAGSEVDISVQDGELIVRPVPRRHDLWALLKEVTSENLHEAIETDVPVGKEAW